MHKQLADQMRAAIVSGRLPPGSKLPSTRVFADELRVGRNTVLQVFETLTGEGLLIGRVGSGTFVTATTNLVRPDAALPEGSADHDRTLSRRGRGIVASASASFAAEDSRSRSAAASAASAFATSACPVEMFVVFSVCVIGMFGCEPITMLRACES